MLTLPRIVRASTAALLAAAMLATPSALGQAQPDLTEGFPAPVPVPEFNLPTPTSTAGPAREPTEEEREALNERIAELRRLAEERRNNPPPKVPVELELALLVDASQSVSDAEWALQIDGYVRAFNDPAIHSLVESGEGVAVLFLTWSSTFQQADFGWQHLRTGEDCVAFATQVSRFPRLFSSNTIMASALGRAMSEIRNNTFEGERFVIDVSGDGVCENQAYYATNRRGDDPDLDRQMGPTWDTIMNSRDPRVVINGISVGDVSGLPEWYSSVLIQGESNFALHASTFSNFATGIREKLLREIAEDPGSALPPSSSNRFAYD